jgi:sulfide dehydrogenase cytochrome subunit
MHKYIHVILPLAVLSVLPAQVTYTQTAGPETIDKLTSQCAGCHGTGGNSTIKTIPSIAGISENYFKYVMQEYKNGSRKSAVMNNFAVELSEEDIDRLATYYARQTFKSRNQAFDKDLAKKGKAIHEKYCAKCHDNIRSPDQYSYGILAGQWIPYLRQAIKEYLNGTRKTNPMMKIKLNRVKTEIGDKGFEQLVNFYASVEPQQPASQSH